MIYLELFLGFLQVGCLSFGGAYAAIPLIREVVTRYGWLGDEQLTYMIAVGESTPGPIMVNLATYVGQSQGGVLGAAIATVAVVLPAFLIIVLVCTVLKRFLQNRCTQAALDGIKPAVAGIILATGVSMMLSKFLPVLGGTGFDWRALVLTLVLAAILFGTKPILKKKISPIVLIAISAVLGAVIYAF